MILYPIVVKPSSILLHEVPAISLPRRLCRLWGLESGEKYELLIGMEKHSVTLVIHDEHDDHAFANECLVQQCPYFKPSLKWRIAFLPKLNQLWFGPIFAILSDHTRTEGHSLTAFLEEFIAYSNKQGCLTYVIHPSEWSMEKANATTYYNSEWIDTFVPLPHVVYNRIGSRRLEKSALVQGMMASFHSHHIPIWNERFLDKGEVHTLLADAPSVREHVPPSWPTWDEATLLQLLAEGKNAFLKPKDGKEGKGIFKLSFDEERLIVHRHTEQVIHFRTVEHFLRVFFFKNKQNYMLQQGISLMRENESVVDFRLLLIKTANGRWKVVSAVARQSNAGHFLTNIAQGGTFRTVQDVLSSWYDQSHASSQWTKMKQVAKDAAATLETSGQLIELGLDMAIDVNDHIWIIEANTKPSKQHRLLTVGVRPSTKKLLAYFYEWTVKNHLLKETD
ncbi:hypothetical protein E2L07_01195 [Halalkalibacterium halodurans]|jgi:glutathione synthase/RimK-type ligase-like ATP-grasp enzyme|uniref:YheC/YheD family endospore coat-associated protein n=1 Tax=Halalkalibacterium halodurans TaxID=86665 RepID=UPI0010674BB8|nr:YheC/YheD family protein [Halalkalibacterium halodurans]TES57971.1 hypothetical protein E2L07_01195 [Halalkalibacterium halodurans]